MSDDKDDVDPHREGLNLPELVEGAISEVLSDAGVQAEQEERIVLAEELVEKFTSP